MAGKCSPEEVMERVVTVFRDVFDDEEMVITESTSADDVPDWDSLMHITLCVALGKEFQVKLSPVEVADLTNVGKLAGLLCDRLEKA